MRDFKEETCNNIETTLYNLKKASLRITQKGISFFKTWRKCTILVLAQYMDIGQQESNPRCAENEKHYDFLDEDKPGSDPGCWSPLDPRHY
jgi:hypothetical protein